MPQAESTAAPEIKKAIILKDPKNGLLTIAIPMTSEESESTKAGPMNTLVDFIETFINPKRKPEQEASEDFRIPCPYYSQCKSIEEPEEIKAKLETASSELVQSGLTPEQKIRLKCLESARSYANHYTPAELTDISGIFFKWVMNGPLEETQGTSGKA